MGPPKTNIVTASGAPVVGSRQGDWVWDGSRWVCCPDGDDCPPAFPPFGPPVFSGPVGQPPWYPGANGGVSFGTVAPPNPVRGHFWWDGLTLWLFDGAAWVGVGGSGSSGTVAVGPTPPPLPLVGALWFNGTQLAIWNGMIWFVVGGQTPPNINPPANPQPGQQWFDGTTLRVWDGNAWVPVSQTKTSIQATAPPGPNAGDLWFDGTQLHIWSGTAWNLVGPGATVGPVATTTITFAMTATTNRAIGSAFTIVPFNDAPLTDTLNGWDSVQHKYTPTRAGIYISLCRMQANGTGAIALLKNDPGTFTNQLSSDLIQLYSSQVGGWIAATAITQMNGTTDYLRFWASSTGTSFLSGGSNPVWVTTLLP